MVGGRLVTQAGAPVWSTGCSGNIGWSTCLCKGKRAENSLQEARCEAEFWLSFLFPYPKSLVEVLG